jgi:hypothetical protein
VGFQPTGPQFTPGGPYQSHGPLRYPLNGKQQEARSLPKLVRRRMSDDVANTHEIPHSHTTPIPAGPFAFASSRFASLSEQRLYQLTTITILIIAFPSNFIYYMAPPFFLAGALLLETAVSARRLLLFVSISVLFTFAALGFDLYAGNRINPAGVLFSLLMYLPFFILLAQHERFALSDVFIHRLVGFLRGFIYIQAVASFLQLTYGLIFRREFNGDFICGTFGLFDVITGITISQVLFTFTVLNTCMFLVAYRHRRGVRLAIGLGFLCCVCAQSGHQIIFFSLTVSILAVVQQRSFGRLIQTVAFVGFLIGLVQLVYPATLRTAIEWAEKVLISERSPKRNVVEAAFEEILKAEHMIVGTGLGQFSSRAALFSSGEYLSVNLPSFLTGKSDVFVNHMMPQLDLFAVVGESSAIAAPYFSIISVFSEFGPLLSVALIAMAIAALAHNAKLSRYETEEIRDLSLYCNFFIVFLFLNCLIENYLEMVQANFIPILLYVLAQGRIRAILASRDNPCP